MLPSRVKSGISGKHWTGLFRVARDKHSVRNIRYRNKKILKILPLRVNLMNFFFVSDASHKLAAVFVPDVRKELLARIN
jgi:hypothetical protein